MIRLIRVSSVGTCRHRDQDFVAPQEPEREGGIIPGPDRVTLRSEDEPGGPSAGSNLGSDFASEAESELDNLFK